VIDWDAPEPPSLGKPRDRVLRTMEEAVALIDEWQAAEAELWTEYLRLHDRYCKMKWRAEAAEFIADNYELLWEHRDKL
jgi:hypothetical protein